VLSFVKNIPPPRLNCKNPAFYPFTSGEDNRSIFVGNQYSAKNANTCLLFQDQRQSIWQGIEALCTDSTVINNAPNKFHASRPHATEYRRTHSKLVSLIQASRTLTSELNDAISSFQAQKSPFTESSRKHEKHFELSQDELRMEYHKALDLARVADLKYGICSRQSSLSWAKVDDIYKLMQMSPSIESENIGDHDSFQKFNEIIEACRHLEHALSRLEKEFNYL